MTLDTGETRRYDALLVANGHHWDPRWPEPPYPGSFDGVEMHSHWFVDAADFRDKNVLVVGIGNSAMDIAVESSFVARRTLLSARRGAHVVPKYAFGRPIDQIGVSPLTPLIPFPVRHAFFRAVYRLAVGRVEDYGLPDARSPAARVPSHPVGRLPRARGAGRGDLEAGDRGAVRRSGSLRGRQRRAGRRDRVVHGLQGELPVLRPRFRVGAGQRAAAVPAGVQAGDRQPVLHRAAPAAGGDHAAGRGPGAVDRLVSARRVPPAVEGRDGARYPARARAHAPPLRGLQAPHDGGRLRRLPLRASPGAPSRRAPGESWPAFGCPCRRAGRRRAPPRRPQPERPRIRALRYGRRHEVRRCGAEHDGGGRVGDGDGAERAAATGHHGLGGRRQEHPDRAAALRLQADPDRSARGASRRLRAAQRRARARPVAAHRRAAGRARAGHHDRRRLPLLPDRAAQVHHRRHSRARALHAQHGDRRVDRRSRGDPDRRTHRASSSRHGVMRSSPRCSGSGISWCASTRWTWSTTRRRRSSRSSTTSASSAPVSRRPT